MKHPFESPPRRLVRSVQHSLIQVLSRHNTGKLSEAGAAARYSLANAYTNFNTGFNTGSPFVKLEVDQLLSSRGTMDRTLETMILSSEKLSDSSYQSDRATGDEQRRSIEKLQTEAVELRAVLTKLTPLHSVIHQAMLLLAIRQAEYRKMSPAARKRRDVFNDRLLAAREIGFKELSPASLEHFVTIAVETAADPQYQSYVSGHQFREIESELSKLLDELVVGSLVLFVTS